MPGQFAQGGVTLRDCSTNRAGFDRVLMAVAATFLAVSATSALAGPSDTPRASAAELAIDAAIPRPEPANVPPPTIADFKMDSKADSTASVPDAANATEKPSEPSPTAKASEIKPAEIVTAPAAKTDDTATTATPPATATAPAAEPAKEPEKAASNVAPADQPVADKLREMLAAKSLRYFDRKNERAAVEKFYSAREYGPQWTQAGKLTDSGKGVIARLKDAAAEGLDPADYPVPDFAATSPDQLAEAELKLTASMLDYARQAQSGRMHWSQAAADILYPEHPTDPAEVLANISAAKDASAALAGYNPPHKLYKDLKAKLAELRSQGDGPVIEIAEGPKLAFRAATKKRPAVMPEDPRGPPRRAKLGITEDADNTKYDAKVAAAVRKFQGSVDLKATGVLDDRTVKAINSPKRDRQIDLVLLNIERLRWLPRQLGAASLGDAYVILNVPDFTLQVVQNDAPIWTTKVVAGKPGRHATPMMTETMKFITVNPTWNVPPSIIYNEYLPALQQDPTVLDRMGLRLERRRDGSIHISQPPGEANALGRIRFNFPNKFLVYQHDTPDTHLFAKEERAFSHGCMRVQNPDQYAATLLGIVMPGERYTAERIRSMYGRREIDLKFPTPIPVHITYQTAFVDEAGKLQFRKDVYRRDAAMIALLKNDRNRDLETMVSHAQPNYSRPREALPPGVNFASDNTLFSGPSFFERLFGGPSSMTPPAPVGRRQQQRFTR